MSGVKQFYLLLCVLGIVLTYSQFIPFSLEHGADANVFVSQAFGNYASRGLAADLLITALAATAFIWLEARRIGLKNWWWAIVAIPLVGICLGLPLFLYLREEHFERQAAASAKKRR